MSRFRPGDRVRFPHVRLHKGIFVTPNSPLEVRKVTEGPGEETTCDVVFLDAEGNPHVIEGVKETELDRC